MHYVLSQKLQFYCGNINSLVQNYGGIFINSQTCYCEGVIVVRVNPVYVQNIVLGIQQMGFLVGDVRISGMQSYIYIRGFMQ